MEENDETDDKNNWIIKKNLHIEQFLQIRL